MKWLKVLCLLLPLAAYGQVSNEGWFTGSTKYKTTNEEITVSWLPHEENLDWEGKFVFDIQVVYYERQETIIDETSINALQYTFSLPRVGHYLVRIRSCKAEEPTVCSAWMQGWEAKSPLVNASEVNNWWIFVWVGAPTNPGVN